jgi:hypothetical protein
MGLDEIGTLHERGLVQATKHTVVSKTCIQRSLHERTQATNQPPNDQPHHNTALKVHQINPAFRIYTHASSPALPSKLFLSTS